ncbi:MAG: sigma-70 family RNA polymerase sigma factor [Bacteroidales bacterium]|nr:sigma-70 family RNA polymerase sigma factor [Bacteroidales bacterium]
MQAQRFWTKAYQRNIGKMIGVCYRYVGDRALAEDLAHDAFLKAIEKSGSFHRLGSFEGWLMRVNLNNTLDYLRRQPTFLSIENIDMEDSREETSVQDDFALRVDEYTEEEILSAIGMLPDKQRAVFNLYVFEGQKHTKIAETLQIGVRSSKRYLAEARAHLQKTLQNKHEHKKSGIMVLLTLISFRGHAIDRLCRAKLGHLTLAPTAPSPLSTLNWASAPKPSVWLVLSATKAPVIAGVGVAAAVAGSVAVWQAPSADAPSPANTTPPPTAQTIALPDTTMEAQLSLSDTNTIPSDNTAITPVETPCTASLPDPDMAIQPEPTEPPLPKSSPNTTTTPSKNHSLKKIQRHGYFGLADEQGNVVVSPKYSYIHPYDEYRSGWAMVELFGFKGFIDSNGREVVHPQYDEIGKFGFYQDGRALVRKGNFYGFIDLTGKEVVPATKKRKEIADGY